MSEFRRWKGTSKRTIVNYNDVVSEIGQSGLFCFDKGVMSILRKFVLERGLWHTSYAISSDSSGYHIPDSTEFEPVYNAIQQFLGEGSIDMSCDIVAALGEIKASIETYSCCGSGGQGSNGAGEIEAPPSAFTDDGTNYPTGYGSYAAYDSEKCQASAMVLEQLDTDLTYLKTLTASTLTVSALTTGFVMLVPAANLVALAAMGLSLLAQGLFVSTVDSVQSSLSTNYNAALCDLYNASTATQAKADLKGTLGLSGASEVLLDYLLTYDMLNMLFDYVSVGDYGADCSICGPCSPVVSIGSDLGSGVYQAVFSSSDGRYWVGVDWKRAGANCDVTLTNLDTSISISNPTNNAYRLYNVAGGLIYSSNTPPTLPIADVHRFNLTDIPGNPFTVTVNYTES